MSHKTAVFPLVGIGVSQMVNFIHDLTLKGYKPAPMACHSGFGMATITMVPNGDVLDVSKTNFEVNSNPDGSESGVADTKQVPTESTPEVSGQTTPADSTEGSGAPESNGASPEGTGDDSGTGAELGEHEKPKPAPKQKPAPKAKPKASE